MVNEAGKKKLLLSKRWVALLLLIHNSILGVSIIFILPIQSCFWLFLSRMGRLDSLNRMWNFKSKLQPHRSDFLHGVFTIRGRGRGETSEFFSLYYTENRIRTQYKWRPFNAYCVFVFQLRQGDILWVFVFEPPSQLPDIRPPSYHFYSPSERSTQIFRLGGETWTRCPDSIRSSSQSRITSRT